MNYNGHMPMASQHAYGHDQELGHAHQHGHGHDHATPLMHSKQPPFLQWMRRRLNVVPIILCFLVPSGVFAGICAAIAFSVHYVHPVLMYSIVGGLVLATLVVGFHAFREKFRHLAWRDLNWWLFLFFSMLLACILAGVAGSIIYTNYMRPYYDMQNLHTYTDLYPNRIRGQMVMDAGHIVFHNGSRVDVKMSMGFKNVDVFCAAPITFGNEALDTYDFWAVGTNCCSGSQADFHCSGFNDKTASSGLRLMSDSKRAYYRLAVQQAEATHKIRAVHPLFFEWTHDATEKSDGWKNDGEKLYFILLACFIIWQLFIVTCASLAFAKLWTN